MSHKVILVTRGHRHFSEWCTDTSAVRHFGSRTLRQQRCRCVLRTLRQCSRTVSWCVCVCVCVFTRFRQRCLQM